jgi:hypothetical protein
MSKVEYNLEILHLEDVSDRDVEECAKLFSNHYAIWGKAAEKASGGKLVEGGLRCLNRLSCC